MNLTIDTGDRVAFLGVNGAGKTTLLKLIGGLLYPTKGIIMVDGYNTVRQNLKARKNVGFVLNEERSFYWGLTGKQNLEFFGTLDNISPCVLSERIDQLINLVGLDYAADKPVSTYSSGMKQRLAMARGLISDPTTLILDEPTRALDPSAVIDVKKIILNKLHKDGRTLLISTHRFDEAQDLCNKVCVMLGGKLLSYSSIEDVNLKYKSIEEYYHHIMSNELKL